MKKYSHSLWVLAVAFLCTSLAAKAQTISYTINPGNSPTLLSRIIGGSLNPIPQGSGIINNGDNIAMQLVNPLSPANTGYKFNITGLPGTATAFLWSVSGDLDVLGPATNPSVTIVHRNINLRNGITDSAQSKGRISFSYGSTIPGCGGRTSYSFEVYKIFNGTNNSTGPGGTTGMLVVPPITGPDCIQPNKQYTYSVDPIVSDNLNSQIGIDQYFWDVATLAAAGITVDYYSTDSSSITFTTGSTVPTSMTLTCGMGQANYPPLQTNPVRQAYATKALQASAGVPVVTLSGASSGTITANVPYCINTNGSTVTPLTFTVTPQSGATYNWTFGTVGAFGTGSVNDWNTSPAQTGPIPYNVSGNSLTIANIFNQPGVVTLTVTDACGLTTSYQYQIRRTLTAADAGLITLAGNCLTPGGSTTVSIATAPATNEANLNTLVWAPLTNWTFPTGSINPGTSVAPGVYTLNASFAGCTSSVPYTVNVKPTTVAITAPSPLCFPASTAGNSVTASPTAASGYTWTSTSGTITGTSSTASLTTGSTSPFNINATYTVAPGCATTSGPVAANLQPITPTYSLPTCINSAAFNITVTNYPGYGTYTLNYVSGTNLVGSYTSSGGTVTVTPNGLPGSGVYKLTHTNGACGTASTNVTITPTAAPFTVSVLFNNGSFAVLGTSNNTLNYTWYNCSTNALLGSTTAPTTTWNLNTPGAANYYFGAEAVVAGCTTRVCINVPGYLARQHSGGITGAPDMPASVGSIFPNPNNGEFSIELKNVSREATVSIYDMNGKEVTRANLTTGVNRIGNINVAAGQYVVALSVDGTFYVHKMTVTK